MKHVIASLTLAAGLTLAASGTALASASEAQGIVDAAAKSISTLASDPNLPAVRDYGKDAKGMLIVPTMVKGGFIIGASGGSGVLLRRGDDGKSFTQPAFYTLGSVTFGLQIGGEVSEIVLMIMTDRGLDSFLSSSVKLGGDVSIAAGPVGAGAKAQIADIVAFSRTKGLYGGINLEGGVVDVRDDWNREYYGSKVRPTDILVKQTVKSDGTAGLRKAVAAVGAGM